MSREERINVKKTDLEDLIEEKVEERLKNNEESGGKDSASGSKNISRREFLKKSFLGLGGLAALSSPVSADFFIKDDSLSVQTSNDNGSTLTEGLFVDENQNVDVPNGALNIRGDRVATRNWAQNQDWITESEAPVQSVDGETGDVSLDVSNVDYLTKNAYIEPSPKDKSIWVNLIGEIEYVYDGTQGSGATQKWIQDYASSNVQSVYVSDGVLYAGHNPYGTDNAKVIAADASDGSLIWETKPRDTWNGIRSVEVDEGNGVIYLGYDDGHMKALNSSDQTEIWSKSYHSGLVNTMCESNGVIYSGAWDGKLIAADSSDGSMIWESDVNGDNVQGVDVNNNIVYAGGSDNMLNAIDASDGSVIWSISPHPEDESVRQLYYSNGVIYTVHNPDVVATDASNQNFLWIHSLHDELMYTVHESGGVVYSGSRDDNVVAVDIDGISENDIEEEITLSDTEQYVSDGDDWYKL